MLINAKEKDWNLVQICFIVMFLFLADQIGSIFICGPSYHYIHDYFVYYESTSLALLWMNWLNAFAVSSLISLFLQLWLTARCAIWIAFQISEGIVFSEEQRNTQYTEYRVQYNSKVVCNCLLSQYNKNDSWMGTESCLNQSRDQSIQSFDI